MIRKTFHRVYSNPFLKNVSKLAAGTIISQFILFASSPILTRIFSATDFGVLALFNSIATVAAIATTGRYEFAVGLPEKHEKGARVVALITLLSLGVSLLYLVILIVLKNWSGTSLSQSGFLQGSIVYLIPLQTFAIACFTALQYWNQRFKSYGLISIANSILIILGVILNIVFGLVGFKKYGLVYSLVLSEILAIIPVFISFYRSSYFGSFKFSGLRPLAREYKNFPRYMLVSDLSLATSQQIVPIIFTILFNPAIVGLYALANRMLKVPSIVFTSSIGNVFRNDAIDVIRQQGNCRNLYVSTLKKLFLLSVPIYGFFAVFSPFIFGIVFGKSWTESGYFARLICINAIFDFLSVPLNSLYYVLGKQKMYMRMQFLNTVCGIIFIYLGNWIWGNAFYSVLLFAISNAVFNIFNLCITYNFSKHNYSL